MIRKLRERKARRREIAQIARTQFRWNRAQFWLIVAAGCGYLEPFRPMDFLERIFWSRLSRMLRAFFLKLAAGELGQKEREMAEQSCTHDMAGTDSRFCPGCGKQLGGDPEIDSYIDRRFKQLCAENGIKLTPAKKKGGDSDPGAGDDPAGNKGGISKLREKLSGKK